MTLTFANFKQVIPQQVLTKGRDYFRKGHIVDLSYDEEEQVWEAQVEGTELYDVSVEQYDTGSLNCSCTCPYDYGDYCKHIAATLYAIEEEFPDSIGVKPRKQNKQRKTRFDKLKELVEQSTQQRLADAVLNLAQNDREILNQLMIFLDTSAPKVADYRRVVKDALRIGRDDYGGYDYMGVRQAANKLETIIKDGEKAIALGEIERALVIFQSIIEELEKAIAYADDSDGELGSILSLAVDGLSECVKHLNETQKDKLYDFALANFLILQNSHDDAAWGLLGVAQNIVDNPVRRERFTNAIAAMEADTKKSRHPYSSFTLEYFAKIRLELIEKFDSPNDIEKFMLENIEHHNMRKLLIEKYQREGKFGDALQFIQGGIALSERQGLPGLSRDYQKMRIHVFQSKGDTSELIQHARKLWLDDFSPELYFLMRKHVPTTDWNGFVEKLIQDVKRNVGRLVWVYAQEDRWQDLIDLMLLDREARSFINEYRGALEQRYPLQVATIYEEYVFITMNYATQRGDYQKVAEYLRAIKKLGQGARAKELVENLKRQYPKRKALHEELSKL